LPRKLEVTPDLTKYWCEQGGKMLGSGLTVPVPYEHDFTAHPMTPKDKLLNNAGWVKEYKLKDNKLFGVVDIQDEETAKKLPKTIRWTSPWINSFTDGNGTKWNNVISHLALTLRPRITKQEPFGSIAAALSMATPIAVNDAAVNGFYISRAGQLVKSDGKYAPRFPMAFSLFNGVSLSDQARDEAGRFSGQGRKLNAAAKPKKKRKKKVDRKSPEGIAQAREHGRKANERILRRRQEERRKTGRKPFKDELEEEKRIAKRAKAPVDPNKAFSVDAALSDSLNRLDGIYECGMINEETNGFPIKSIHLNRVNRYRSLTIIGYAHAFFALHENIGVKFKQGKRYRVTIEEITEEPAMGGK